MCVCNVGLACLSLCGLNYGCFLLEVSQYGRRFCLFVCFCKVRRALIFMLMFHTLFYYYWYYYYFLLSTLKKKERSETERDPEY